MLRSSKTYIYIFCIFSAIGFLGLISFNLLIDSHHLFRIIVIDGINKRKYQVVDESVSYTVKALDLRQGNYDALILGTSRAHQGIDPLNPVFDGKSAYNAAFEGATIYDIRDALKFSIKHQSLRTVVLGLDMGSFKVGKFNGEKSTTKSKFVKINSNYDIYLRHFDRLISYYGTINSIKTIAKNINNHQPEVMKTDRGFRQRNLISANARHMFRKQLNESLFATNLHKNSDSFSIDSLNAFRDIIIACRQNNIELYVFISPTHARHLEKFKALGKFSDFEQWKRKIVTILEEEKTSLASNTVTLWDFSGYNHFTTENIPPEKSPRQMQWYFEASHYKKELGDKVLFEMMANKPLKRSNDVSSDSRFGILLDINTIEPHLAYIREQGSRYREQNPHELTEIQQAIRDHLQN
ncbi:hypothetical protein [Acaryochloris sp. IP29b_bin.148]|uniref:hypothetical protein n=1 Tax=Acaryochloris sp. IP29b_bin.148 TaxID=2969218 RepID=UPI00260FDE36|nr:hypothetical protein [Acaryochloris sp. IP29b_bin.148]